MSQIAFEILLWIIFLLAMYLMMKESGMIDKAFERYKDVKYVSKYFAELPSKQKEVKGWEEKIQN